MGPKFQHYMFTRNQTAFLPFLLGSFCFDQLAFQTSLSVHIYPTPPLGQDMTQGQFFKRGLTGLNSEFYQPLRSGRI